MREEKDSWFDDPEWESLRREVHNRPLFNSRAKMKSPSVAQNQPAGSPQKVNVSINFSLPKVKLPKLFTRVASKIKGTKFSRKQLIIGGAACLVLVSSFGVLRAISGKGKSSEVASGVLGEAAKEPEFRTVLPEGDADYTSSKKIAYDAQKKVASYTDTLNGVPITVSQQPLPDSFKDDPDGQVKKIAENFSANKEIKAGGLVAYLGTSAKGPQSLVLKRGDLLIFIFSQRAIPDDVWGTYILALE